MVARLPGPWHTILSCTGKGVRRSRYELSVYLQEMHACVSVRLGTYLKLNGKEYFFVCRPELPRHFAADKGILHKRAYLSTCFTENHKLIILSGNHEFLFSDV
jgi:hypothetical protein